MKKTYKKIYKKRGRVQERGREREREKQRQDIKRTIFLSWKILCESLHLSRKNRLVFSALLRNSASEF